MFSKRYSQSETRREDHLRLLEQLESMPLPESCCEVCHCECYDTHRSSEADKSGDKHRRRSSESTLRHFRTMQKPTTERQLHSNAVGKNNSAKRKPSRGITEATSKVSKGTKKIQVTKVKLKKATSVENCKANAREGIALGSTPEPEPLASSSSGLKRTTMKRSRSVSSVHSQQSGASISNMRDCRILQEMLSALNDNSVEQCADYSEKKATSDDVHYDLDADADAKIKHKAIDQDGEAPPLKLCESLASLCLSTKVRQAFQTVPAHDKRILNRMARKRSESAAAKENAWLARKYWENERYERELLKCEEMDEYRKAVLDKQFQDYLRTKARLNEIAQRDLLQLQRLRSALEQKDERSKRRLDQVRTERGILQCQRRCDELRKCETVNMNQEEHQLDEALRKQAICQRLGERLERADQLRAQILETYLKRVRCDNTLEQMLHEKKWREAQKSEQKKREQLKEHISRKRSKSQRFVENKQRRNEVLARTAELSASLRELVRSSVTPDPEVALIPEGLNAVVSKSLDRLLPDRSKSRAGTK